MIHKPGILPVPGTAPVEEAVAEPSDGGEVLGIGWTNFGFLFHVCVPLLICRSTRL